MKSKILSIALLSSVLTLSAQVSQKRTVESFNKIQVSDAVNVVYTQSDTVEVSVNGNEKELSSVETKVEKSTLIISAKGKFYNPVTVYVKNNALEEVMCSGASDLKTTNAVKGNSILFSVSGAAHVSATIEAKTIKDIQSGASELILSGSADQFEAEISGASSLKGYNLKTLNANIVTTGASSAKVNVSDKLTANASGASSIKVKGSVKDISAEATSAASISRIMDDKKSNGKDSTTFNWKGKKVIIIGSEEHKTDTSIVKKSSHKHSFDHWAGFSLGVNGLLTSGGSVSMPSKYNYLDLNYSRSINFQLNFFQHNFHIYKNYVNLVTGFGIEWRRYMLDNKTTLNPDSSFTWGTIDSTSKFAYNKNLFKSTMLQVPLLLEFNTSRKPSKTFHIAVGAVGQFMVNSKTKQKLELNGDNYTKIHKDSYNMSPFQLKAHASIGYSNFTVFGEYNVTPLFAANKGPVLYPFVVGVRLIPFGE
ncbi:MAG: GIN domain-containing protein [Bacteroidia bacterium]